MPDNGQPSKNIRIYYLAILSALLIWSSSFIATKVAYTTFTPITLGAARFVIASIVLGVILLVKKEFVKPGARDLAVMAVSGMLGITIYFTLENSGVSLTTASHAVLIIASFPAITALLELIIFKIKPSRVRLLGIGIAITGIYILNYSAYNPEAKNQMLGNLLLIAAGFVWAFYNFLTRQVVNKYPAITLSFYQTVAGTICFIPLAFLEKGSWQPPTPLSIMMLIYLGGMCSVTAFLCYNFGLRRLSPGKATSLMNLVPLFGVIFSVLILKETVSWQQLIGGGTVVSGVLLSVRDRKQGATSAANNM